MATRVAPKQPNGQSKPKPNCNASANGYKSAASNWIKLCSSNLCEQWDST
ncbi:MAG: hypothetical protein NZM28_01890 [Fimbriimonadales bacterium]|nr:hypothetical protein [Fimbriimonadales bacterium]